MTDRVAEGNSVTPKGETEIPFEHTQAVDTLQTVMHMLREDNRIVSEALLQRVYDYLGSIY